MRYAGETAQPLPELESKPNQIQGEKRAATAKKYGCRSEELPLLFA
jgi:hypothetical protein